MSRSEPVFTEAEMIEAAEAIRDLTSNHRIRWMVDRKGNERWGYASEPLPKGWRHLCWEGEVNGR